MLTRSLGFQNRHFINTQTVSCYFEKMNNQIKSALILLENVFFNPKKFNRKEFAEKLNEENLKHSETTITRLLQFISSIFGVELSFKTKNGKVKIIDSEDNQFQLIRTLLLLGKLKNESNIVSNNIISFTSESQFLNVNFVLDFYEAISKSQMLKIDYQKFNSDLTEKIIVKPILIKEYLGRWYLIAEKETGGVRVFGIERIKNFEVLNKTFSPNLEMINLYKSTIGVNYSGSVELVKIWVENYQLEFFKTYPIHKSQKIIKTDENGGILTIKVNINYELKQLLASYLDKVRVIEPLHLKIEMIDFFETMTNDYQK